MITQLEVINDMLGLLGEAPLNQIDEGHDLVASGLRAIKRANTREQVKGWWFNSEVITLTPDTNGHITIPQDTISIDPTNTSAKVSQRGRRLYKLMSGPSEDPFVFTADVQVCLIREIEFDDLPVTAQVLISLRAMMIFQRAFDADTERRNSLRSEYQDAYLTLKSEHIRSVDVNLLRNGSVGVSLARLRGWDTAYLGTR